MRGVGLPVWLCGQGSLWWDKEGAGGDDLEQPSAPRNLEYETPCDLGLQRREVLLSVLRTVGNHRKPLSGSVTREVCGCCLQEGPWSREGSDEAIARAQASEDGGLGGQVARSRQMWVHWPQNVSEVREKGLQAEVSVSV